MALDLIMSAVAWCNDVVIITDRCTLITGHYIKDIAPPLDMYIPGAVIIKARLVIKVTLVWGLKQKSMLTVT